MMKISLIHPFTPKAAGVKENSVQFYHSQPHRKSIEMLAVRDEYDCSIEYFSSNLRAYNLVTSGVTTRFFPVTWKFNGDHKKWKKQYSLACLRAYEKGTPNVTIINMSGHSSRFSLALGKLIKSKSNSYIAMLGGQSYTDAPWIREYYRGAHHLLVHTKIQKEKMMGMEVFRDLDIRIFPLGVDCNFFSPRSFERPDNNKISLLFIGRIVELKRIQLAIEVVKRLVDIGRDANLTIVGPVVSKTYYLYLKELVKKYSLQEHIIFTGYQDHVKLRDILLRTDMLLLPSENETFGMVIVESMACGVPVAGVKGGHGPDEVIKDGVNGVLTTADHFVDAVIQFLLMNRDELNHAKEAARQTVLSKYSIEETYRVLKKSIEDCLA